MRRGAVDSRTSFCHHPVQDPQPLVVTGLLDHLPLPRADSVRNPDRLFRRIETFELPLVVHQDLLKSARVEAPDRARAAVPDRREIPPVAEVTSQLRLASLRLPPFVAEHAVPEPFLAPELRSGGILRRPQSEEMFQSIVQLGLRPGLVDLLRGFLLFL